jgi:hypothetical protein
VQSIVFICPFCSKDLSNNALKSRISHLKNCSKKAKEKSKENPIVVDSPLPKEVSLNKSNTVPPVTEMTAPKKDKKHKNKSEKKIKVVKSKFFENQPPVSPPKILSKYKRNTSEGILKIYFTHFIAESVKPKKKVSKKKSRDENLDVCIYKVINPNSWQWQ